MTEEFKQIMIEIEDIKHNLDVTELMLNTVNDKEEYIMYLLDKIDLAKKLLELDEKRLKLLRGESNDIN